MEKKLKSMFEFQRFAQNPRLARLISETQSRCEARALEDDDLWMVNAAGAPEDMMPRDKKNDQ